jgi:hypothetical protein
MSAVSGILHLVKMIAKVGNCGIQLLSYRVGMRLLRKSSHLFIERLYLCLVNLEQSIAHMAS